MTGVSVTGGGVAGARPIEGTAVALALDADGPLLGLLLTGPPGTGKTTAALTLIEGCRWARTRLVSDDGVLLAEEGGALVLQAHPATAGSAELVGTGLVRLPHLRRCTLDAAVLIDPGGPRLPAPARYAPLGAARPHVPLYRWRGGAGLVSFLRSIAAGHSQAGGHDAVLNIEDSA